MTYYEADLIENKHDPGALSIAINDAMTSMNFDPTTPGAGVMAQNAAHTAARRVLAEGNDEARRFLDATMQAVRRISAMPGQRTIVLISPGVYLPLDLHLILPQILEHAIRSGVVINTLDARGLKVIYPDGDIADMGGNPRGLPDQAFWTLQSDLAEGAVLGELADGTGGTWFHNSNNLDEGLRRLSTHPEFIYYLAFSPTNLKTDGKYHSLKVQIRNAKDLTVQARRGYFAAARVTDPAEAAKQEIQDALFSGDEVHDLAVQLQTQFFKSGETAKLVVLAKLDPKTLQFHKDAGRNRNDLTVVSGVFDRNGNFISALQKMVEMRLKDETLAGTGGIAVRSSFDVTPGSYIVRLVVRDSEQKALAAESAVVEIP